MSAVDRIFEVLRAHGGKEYGGERISQLDHALQCASLAEQGGCPPALVAACLLHDFGHLVHELGAGPAERGIDDRHEVVGRDWLGQYFAEDVTGPVWLHVDAKRYLCATDECYFAILSPASVRSLELQGGAFDSADAERFASLPHASAATKLRRFDDAAKVPGLRTPDLERFRPHLEACLRPGG